jgi:uncharacterized membrane protein
MNCLVKYGLAAVAPLALACNAARAEIIVCNDFRAPIYVALAAEDGRAVNAAGWWSLNPNECKPTEFPFQGTSLYYTADSASYRAGRATSKDHWGNKRPLFVPNQPFKVGDAQSQRPGARLMMFGEAVVSEQFRGKPLSITVRFSAGNTTVNMKSN